MNTIKIFTFLAILILSNVLEIAKAQQVVKNTDSRLESSTQQQIRVDTTKQRRIERHYYQKHLAIDSVKASKVQQIIIEYKTALNKVMADTTFNDSAKRAAVDELISQKNAKLGGILNPVQQLKIIPSSELRQQETKKNGQ